MLEVLTNPRGFFEKLEDFSLKIPVFLVLLMTIPSAVMQWKIFDVMLRFLPAQVIPLKSLAPIFGLIWIVSSFLTGLVILLITAGIIHLISTFLGGEGGYGRSVVVIGYGLVPMVFVSYIQAVLFLYRFSQAGEFTSIQDLIAFIINRESLLSSVIISAAGLAWSVSIWSIGISVVRNLEFKKALLSCLIPAVIYLGYTLYGIYSLGNLEGFAKL